MTMTEMVWMTEEEVNDGNSNTDIYDHDNDGIEDRFDWDIDNDGIDNWNDLYENGSDASRDHDNDGLNDGIDPDDDNDNILDVDETLAVCGGLIVTTTTMTAHGIPQTQTMTTMTDFPIGGSRMMGTHLTGQFDHDNDGIPDYLDDDDDGDGIPDIDES